MIGASLGQGLGVENSRKKKEYGQGQFSFAIEKNKKKKGKMLKEIKKEGKHLSIIEIFKIFRSQELQ